MLVSPKWQRMWLESQHCSKSIVNIHSPSQQTQKALEDLSSSCCSPNKAVQLEALKCWRVWINNQSSEDWKLNTVCFTAVRPLISKKFQPLFKDVDIYKMKLSLMWALMVKVQSIMHLEGPQYILEVFLQSCLNWLFSINEDGCNNEISVLIFQLVLSMFKRTETLSDCDKNMFPPLSTDILLSNKIFHLLTDKFLIIFIHWKEVRDKKIMLKLWKYFLEHCELSCAQIPVPVWQKIFKLAGQICSEKNESIKERLSFLHSCATTLKSPLLSSKFIDFGNLLRTPCEALFKKLVELCTVEYNELYCCDLELFMYSKEICQILSDRTVAVNGFDLCISVVDVLEEFWLRPLFWGVWCGLVDCYKVHLFNIDRNNFSKVQMQFWRKLRGIAANFELDRDSLHEDCIAEVLKHIEILNIGCLCTYRPKVEKAEDCDEKVEALNVMNVDIRNQPLYFVSFPEAIPNPPLSDMASQKVELMTSNPIFEKCLLTAESNKSKLPFKTVTLKDSEVDVVSAPVTRSRNRAENEESKTEIKNQRRKKRKSFEVLVQEIVRKNKERKDEKNHKKRSSVLLRGKQNKKKGKNKPEQMTNKKRQKMCFIKGSKEKQVEVSLRKLRNCKKEEPISEKNKEKKSLKADGKLENYFKVINKKLKSEVKEEKIKRKKEEKNKQGRGRKNSCKDKEIEKKGETAWRQTSLKTMMNEKSKPEKFKRVSRSRNKAAEVSDEKSTKKRNNIKVTKSPLEKLTSFKKIIHDHEYAKSTPEELQTIKKDLRVKKSRNPNGRKAPKKHKKSECEISDLKTAGIRETKAECEKPISPDPQISESKDLEKPASDMEVQELTAEKSNLQEEQKEEMKKESPLTSKSVEDAPVIKPNVSIPICDTPQLNFTDNNINVLESPEGFNEIASKKAKKRVKIFDGMKLRKKIKLDVDDDEKLPLEITEKENLEEKKVELNCFSKTVQEKNTSLFKNDGSPKEMNGLILSRAIRMIALVPESIKSNQVRLVSPTPVEFLKSKKAPNVDKNSRASKMLALLSENVVKVEEIDEFKGENINCSQTCLTTPNKTLFSCLKSSKSMKKRRSIRFDDAKNETVTYQTDTPPSQILTEKEKTQKSEAAKNDAQCELALK